MEEFSFAFDLALAPEFKAELSGEDTVDYYDIQVDDKMIDGQVKMYTQRAVVMTMWTATRLRTW